MSNLSKPLVQRALAAKCPTSALRPKCNFRGFKSTQCDRPTYPGSVAPIPTSTLDLRIMTTVTGISDHCGWAELVTLSVRDRAPVILERQRVELIEPGLASAPYHHEGLELPLDEAELVIRKTRASVADHCRRVLDALKSSFGVDAIVIQESPYKELPESLSRLLSSRPMTCAADGMLYREELASQASAIGLVVHRFPRKSDQIAAASKALGCSGSELATFLSKFGKSIGAPWRKEHKHVAAAALCILAGSNDLRR